jgi:hypothetical protein
MIATYKHAFERLSLIYTDVSGALHTLRELIEDSPPERWGDVMSAMGYMQTALVNSREYDDWPSSAQRDMELIDAGISMTLAWLTELNDRLFAASQPHPDQLDLFESLPFQFRPESWEEEGDR